MKAKILVVLPEIPFPPRKNGLALRYYPLLLRLSRHFDLTLACVVSGEHVDLGGLADVCKFVRLSAGGTRPSFFTKVAAQAHRFSPVGVPFSYYEYGAADIARQLRPTLDLSFSAVVWVTLGHLLHICLPQLKKHRLVIDAVDSISLHLIRSRFNAGLWERLSVAKTRRWETALMDSAYAGFYISPVDLDAIKNRVRNVKLDISPNGTLIEDYTTDKAPSQSPSLGFLGNMSYGPNIDAVHRLHRIYQSLKDRVPGLSLYIIGRSPDASLLPYADDPDVHLTGTVDNIWPHINAVDIFVMPMAKGAGQQNKLLEVMYAGRPIVASSVANGGVLAIDDESVLIADDDEALREKILRLIENPLRREQIAVAGARFVREVYDWDAIAARFAATIEE